MAEFRTKYDDKPRVQRKMPPEDNPMAAKESMKDECDINRIMSRYALTGAPPPMAQGEARYGDFSTVTDYLGALNQVNQAKYAFSQLPSKIRKRFGNDPAELIYFLEDPTNLDEAVSLGLVEDPRQPELPLDPPPVAPAQATPTEAPPAPVEAPKEPTA